jgi:hypothetical protein
MPTATQVVSIPENLATTFLGQKSMSGKRVYEILTEMYTKYAEQPWFGAAGLEFKMTKLTASSFVAYLNTLKNTDCCHGVDRVNVDGMMSTAYTLNNISFNGIPITVRQEWDGVINSSKVFSLNQGNNARVQPHRILLTYKENLVIGTTEIKSLNDFSIWHSKDDKKIYMEGGSYIGASIIMRDEYILAI